METTKLSVATVTMPLLCITVYTDPAIERDFNRRA